MIRFLSFGLVAASFGIGASVANAQNFVGPRYPGEVIISERVITPEPEPAGANTLPPPAKRNGSSSVGNSGRSVLVKSPNANGQSSEPMSLSDGGLRRVEEPRERLPLLALGHEVWQKMLSLERENAKLEATLEYERRLATFREHSDQMQKTRAEEIERMKTELAAQRDAARHEHKAAQARVAEMARLIQERTEQIVQLERKVHQAETAMPTKAVAEKIRQPLTQKLKEQSEIIQRFEARQKELMTTIALLEHANEQAQARIAKKAAATDVEGSAIHSADDHAHGDHAHEGHGDHQDADHAHGVQMDEGHANEHGAARGSHPHGHPATGQPENGQRDRKPEPRDAKSGDKKNPPKADVPKKDSPKRDVGKKETDAKDADKRDRDRKDAPRPEPNRRDNQPRGKKGRFRGAATTSDQPVIKLAVLPVGFSIQPLSDDVTTAAPISAAQEVSAAQNTDDANTEDPVGLQGGVIGPLGKNDAQPETVAAPEPVAVPEPVAIPEAAELPAPKNR
ncbi:secreted protein [Rhodopirellula sp. SWK7]|uniref:secreted protein n=1 Tax=Rhodopirellula sp. SWK7 TaxID=595460 RepID=UPI0002BD2E69|nr:secreted protein [Rhodopirellula sp. SWK7]EMI41195.1 secreted protein [Rhodopirellula sp. SWK7]